MDLTKKETAALNGFRGTDETRAYLCQVWTYVSDGGRTDMATNGHVLVVRREGTHVGMSVADIAKLPTVQPQSSPHMRPPQWPSVLRAPHAEGKNLEQRSVNPAYFALVAAVESAELARRKGAIKRKPNETAKAYKARRNRLDACSVWTIGVDALDGWYWRISESEHGVLWEGIIMPRRV